MYKVYQSTGTPLATKKITSADTAQELPTAYMGSAATRITETGWSTGAYAALITVETNPIRFALGGTTPTNDGSTALGHVLAAGESILLDGEDQVNSFQFVSKTAASPGVLHVTPYIRGGR